ncbi:MAG TPA: HAMP domain-containing sensor histidine kinase [Bacteroidia bacterium]|nr:HAMP domain-containing sensor histidine kinase [Bacteroidia bacterium]
MQKSKITLIIVLMSIALLGIIFLQIYWIKHDFTLKEQQFDHQVSEAMNSVVNKLETRQALNFIGNNFFRLEDDTSFWKTFDSNIEPPEPAAPPAHPPTLDSLSIPPMPPVPQYEMVPDSSMRKMIGDIRRGIRGSIKKDPYSNKIEISDSSLTGNKFHKEELEIKTDSDFMTTEFNHLKIDQEVGKIERAMARNDMMQAEIERQKIRNEQEFVKDNDSPIKGVSQGEMDTLIKTELKNKGINTSYNFGVLSERNDSLVMAKNSFSKNSLLESKYKTGLFPNEIVSRGENLLLYFPSRTTFVLADMLWMLSGSTILTLTIIIVFAYTVHLLMRQKKLSDIKSDFINNMTHEFKTPIATIALAVDAINNPKVHEDKEKVQYYSNIIREENKRMNRQVETILQTALFEKKDFKINKIEIDIHQLISKAAENIKLQVESRHGSIVCKLNATNHIIQGDEILLTTAIVNLLDNANKYSPDKPDINVSTENRESGILISVEDKGMGMSGETMNNIFEKFYRQQTGNIHDVKGFGLGLSHVKDIVTAHGGEIKATSEPGNGSRFDLYLPVG